MHIMLIDDSEDDLLLLSDALTKVNPKLKVTTADSGTEALSFLHESAEVQSAPQLIMLDINMPVLSGFDVLSAIRNDPQTRTLPVVVLTTSDDPDDVRRAYEVGANSFLRKPLELEALRDLAGRVCAYWFSEDLLRDEAAPSIDNSGC